MADVPHQHDSQTPEFPERLSAGLNDLYQMPVAVPSRVDDAILNRARAHLAGTGTRRWSLRWAGAAVATAACLLLVSRVALRGPISPDDLDGNRRVDIVDALKLAHQITAGQAGRDINHDGVVNRQDIDAIAMVAVQLNAGGVQ